MPEVNNNISSYSSGDYKYAKSMFEEDWNNGLNDSMEIYNSPALSHSLNLNNDQILEKENLKLMIKKTINGLLNEAAWKFNNVEIDPKKRISVVEDAYANIKRLEKFLEKNTLNFSPKALFAHVRKGVEDVNLRFPNIYKTTEERKQEIIFNISRYN